MKTRYGLRIRLATAYMSWSVLVSVLVGFLAYYLLVTRMETRIDQNLLSAANVLAKPGSGPETPPAVDVPYVIVDTSGNLVRRSGDAIMVQIPFTPAAQDAAVARNPAFEVFDTTTGRLRVLDLPFLNNSGNVHLLRVAASLRHVDEVRGEFASILVWLVPFVAVAGALSAWLVLKEALRPVQQISLAAQRITASSLPATLPVRGSGDELDQVSAAFNSIIAQMHTASQRMWRYMSNISHELRTPIAALRAETEVALRWAQSEEEYRRVLSSNIEELDRITKTVSDMLDLARAEAGQIDLERKPENLAELARTAVAAMEALAAQHGVQLELAQSENVVAEVAPEQVLRLLFILMDNAIKYSYSSGTVKVAVRGRGEWAVISVSDRGRGIAPEDLPHIFERFYRSQDGRTREIEGTGLGLSHADWIVKTHGGHIDVESKLGRGTRFNVWLPTELEKPATAAAAVHSDH